ncbi:MAG: hypothetical protein COB66_01945 [Coxiella sp. (in: Bacteria)]|nr:MAG: hypothetical protein COB66_01945 [Coxiella sp. (in: g-proteobacteria)]
MIKDFLKSLFADYEHQLITKLLLVLCFVGGLMMAILILAMVLLLLYPPYRWCVFGGFVLIWAITLLILYGYHRITKAEQQARVSPIESLEHCTELITTAIVTIVDRLATPKRKR